MKTIRKYSAYLDDDVRTAFPDDKSVNEALRVILKAAQNLAANRPKRKRTANYAEKENCRVIVKSGNTILYETPTRQSRRELRNRIIRNQRRILQKDYPELKTMRNVQYVVQWREGNRWITDEKS